MDHDNCKEEDFLESRLLYVVKVKQLDGVHIHWKFSMHSLCKYFVVVSRMVMGDFLILRESA